MLWKKRWCRTKKYPLLDFIVILLWPEALEDPHMTILKLGELFCMLCWMVHGRMRIKKEAWFGVKGMANLYITVCLRKQSMNFFEVSKNEYKAANSNDARKLRGLLVARSVVLVFLQKKGQILEVRPQNYENATIYVVQRIRNMGYTTTYTQHCGRVTRFKRNGPKRLLSFRFLNLMSPKRHINILLASL